MKKRTLIGATLLLLALSLVFGFALRPHAHAATAAGKPFNLFPLEHRAGKPGKHGLAAHALTLSCNIKGKPAYIDVTMNFKNDADSGQAGNYWGYDTMSRHIQVWNQGADHWCAVVSDSGRFAAVKGQRSPGSTASTGGHLSGEEVGSIKGGYVLIFDAAVQTADLTNWPMHGAIDGGNPLDYRCHINADGTLAQSPCAGYIDWLTGYFNTSISGSTSVTNFAVDSMNPWSWTYTGHDANTSTPAGIWVNASTGNSGDILDVD